MKFYATSLLAAAAVFGLSACNKQSAETPQAIQEEAQPAAAAGTASDAAPAVTDTETIPGSSAVPPEKTTK